MFDNNSNTIADSIKDMLHDSADKTPPDMRTVSVQLSQWPMWGFCLGVPAFLVGVVYLFINTPLGVVIAVTSVAVFVASVVQNAREAELLMRAKNHNAEVEKHRRNLETVRLTHRGNALDSLKDIEVARMGNLTQHEIAKINAQATVESAKYQALGQSGQLQWEKDMQVLSAGLAGDEAKNEREWRSIEAEKDRNLAIEKMTASFEGKINEIKIRMEYEKPDARSRLAEEMVLLDGKLAQLKTITKYEEEDPILYNALFEKFKRDFN